MSTVWKVVDDTDPRIVYSGDWSLNSSTYERQNNILNDISTTGDVYNNTLHVSRTNGTSFTFKFNGTSLLGLYGTWITFDSSSFSSTPQLPDTQCFLDGVSILTFSTMLDPGIARNNKILCRADPSFFEGNMFSGEHELFVNSTVHTPFTVDYIVYEALPDAEVDGDVLQMGNNVIQFTEGQDPHLSFSAGWGNNDNDAVVTSIPGSSVSVKFNGTGIQLYGELSGNSSNIGTYQVDDQPPKTFQLFSPGVTVGSISDTRVWTDQLLFNLSNLSPGEHTVVVAHNGTSSGMPLAIDYFYVTSLTAEEQVALTPSDSDLPQSSSNPTGAIVGGVIGGLAVLVLLGFAAWMWRRRLRRRRQEERERPHPFTEIQPSVSASRLITEEFDPYKVDQGHFYPSTSGRKSSGFLRSEKPLSPSGESYPLSPVRYRDSKQQGLDQQDETRGSEPESSGIRAGESPRDGPPMTTGPGPSISPPSNVPQASMVVHTDSGLRMREDGVFSDPEHIVEVPPNYTPT